MVRRERHGGCAGGGAGLLRGPGEEARLVLLVDTRPPRRVHALRPSFALLEVGEPVPLFTDRFLGIYLPLGLVRGVLVGAAVAGGQARGADSWLADSLSLLNPSSIHFDWWTWKGVSDTALLRPSNCSHQSVGLRPRPGDLPAGLGPGGQGQAGFPVTVLLQGTAQVIQNIIYFHEICGCESLKCFSN